MSFPCAPKAHLSHWTLASAVTQEQVSASEQRVLSMVCVQVVPVGQADVLSWHLLHLRPPVPRPS